MYFNLKTGAFGKDASGAGLRSYIQSAGGVPQGGTFAVFSKLSDGTPNDLGLRFRDATAANTFIKAVVDVYGELWVLELEKVGEAEKPQEDINFSEEAPF